MRFHEYILIIAMAIDPTDIRSLSDFLRNHRTHMERLADTGRPEVLTVNGRARVVIQDAEAYQRVAELADRMEAILAVREALESVGRGEGISLEELDRAVGTRRGRRSAGTDGPE